MSCSRKIDVFNLHEKLRYVTIKNDELASLAYIEVVICDLYIHIQGVQIIYQLLNM